MPLKNLLVVLAVTLIAAAPAPSHGALGGTLPAPGVVWVSDGSAPQPSTGTAITQKDKTFFPELSVVGNGTLVRFRSEDTLDHSVYTLSALRRGCRFPAMPAR